MIAFASLFLGLIAGVLPVRVIVGEPVARVELELDARPVARIEGKPWSVLVDFGSELSPHELVARAMDKKGEEIGRARQWINLPRPPAEVQILVEQGPGGRAVAARLAWQSVFGPRPERAAVTFDGQELALDGQNRVSLPPYDPAAAHILTAQLSYPHEIRSRADVVLGGGSSGEARSELTAVSVSFGNGIGQTRSAEALRGRFCKRGEPLPIAAVESGPADVIVVRGLDPRGASQQFQRLNHAPYDPTLLDREDRLRIVWPVAEEIPDAGGVHILFGVSREFRAGFWFLLSRIEYPRPTASPRRFTDAVAVAGLDAFASCSRRAVVLVVGSADRDESHFAPEVVRRYLERLHVPLYVWALDAEAARRATPSWGEVQNISSIPAFGKAVEDLRHALESQTVVWLEGRHLPQDITLDPEADELEISR